MRNKIILIAVLIFSIYSCKKENNSCSDGIQNNGETGIDCGGPCSPCAVTSARDSAILDYNTNYLGSAVINSGWTGNTATCEAGTVPQTTLDKVIQRINYFRRMVGLNDNTTFDATLSPKFQQTALMMKANYALSHTPPNTWNCWTASGADGASKSNLASNSTTSAISDYIHDYGSGNYHCGHRRWVLHSAKTKFGYGTTDTYSALGVIGVAGGNTKIPPFIAYPPKAYIPQQLVFPRWSFGIPGANFAAANVTMTGPSGNITLIVISKTDNGYGDNTIVWEPQAIITNSSADVQYSVTVSGITGATNSSYTYTVTIIKP